MRNYTFLLVFFTYLIGFSQEKFEKEYRIKESEAPTKATALIAKWDFAKKVKWYAEESNDGKTFEAKVNFQKHRYSIEFSEDGNLIDIEKTVKFKNLAENRKIIISNSLKERFKKVKIKKTQLQFTSTNLQLFDELFTKNNKSISITPRYELVIKAKKENNFALYEIVINLDGKILKQLKFKPSDSVNLEF